MGTVAITLSIGTGSISYSKTVLMANRNNFAGNMNSLATDRNSFANNRVSPPVADATSTAAGAVLPTTEPPRPALEIARYRIGLRSSSKETAP